MKSRLLSGKLRELFGGDGEGALKALLASAASDNPRLAQGIPELIAFADRLVSQLSTVHQVQSELSGDAFSDWNMKTGRIDSGKQWKAMLGYADGDIDDSIVAWRGLVLGEDLQAFNAAISAHVAGNTRSFQVECRLKSKKGTLKSIFVKGSVVARDEAGKPARMLLLQRDVTDFRRTAAEALSAKEAAEAANRARSFFMANMSHEIRTPMNGIIGMTELALDTQLDAEQRHYLRTAKSSAETLLAIVNDILDFSKIEAGKLRFEEIPFAVSNLVFEAVRAQAVTAHKKGLEVTVTLADDVPARIVGDPTRVRQVITNLVGNAVKFTEQGDISVEVDVEERSISSVLLRFAVRDTGIGIPASRQGMIFEAFSQADDSTTRRFGGTGLGLTICTHLVQMMGGRVWLESVEGQGSCFYFTGRFGVDSAAALPSGEPQFSGQRALVIEKNPAVSGQLVAFLAQAGVQAAAMADAAQAVAAIDKANQVGFPYDFVLADFKMPAPAGLALAEAWQGSERKEKLIMLLTTEQQRQNLQHLRDLGVHAHLVKPIAPEDLVEAMKLASMRKGEPIAMLDPFDLSDRVEPPRDRLKVLLVEDNPVNQELAVRLLKNRGCVVTLANNGAEAVDSFESSAFDLIFMDMQMPVMDGLEATESIRSREMRRSWVVSQEFKPVYIIAMTANAMEGDRERCLQAGMNDYVSKPIKPEELYAAIDRGRGVSSGNDAPLPEPPPPADAGDTCLDLGAAMRDLGDRNLLQTMAAMLVNEWDLHLSRIHSDLADKNAPQLCMDAHTVKSLLAIFHGEAARRIALELEHAAKSTDAVDWERCAQLAATLETEMNRLKPEMERFVQSEAQPA
jgi:protein-histidine pros-kinase